MTALRNLGPVSEALLREIGIETAEQLREVGAPLAYRMLEHRRGSANKLFLYALAGALDDRDLNSYSPAEKAALVEEASAPLEVG